MVKRRMCERSEQESVVDEDVQQSRWSTCDPSKGKERDVTRRETTSNVEKEKDKIKRSKKKAWEFPVLSIGPAHRTGSFVSRIAGERLRWLRKGMQIRVYARSFEMMPWRRRSTMRRIKSLVYVDRLPVSGRFNSGMGRGGWVDPEGVRGKPLTARGVDVRGRRGWGEEEEEAAAMAVVVVVVMRPFWEM
jgi:hypothetical protein